MKTKSHFSSVALFHKDQPWSLAWQPPLARLTAAALKGDRRFHFFTLFCFLAASFKVQGSHISTVSLLQENLSERGAGGLLEELCLLLSNCGRLSVVPWLPAPLASLPYLLSFPTHHRGQTAWTGRTGGIRQYC